MRTALALAALLLGPALARAESPHPGASTTAENFSVAGPLDADRFSTLPASVWEGLPGETSWWWSVAFDEPRPLGAILQVIGTASDVLTNAPRQSVWEVTTDGRTWETLDETRVEAESRLFRLHRLKAVHRVLGVRIRIDACWGDAPALRSVELLPATDSPLAFPAWIVAVSTVERRDSLEDAAGFVSLAHRCPGWHDCPAQRLWMGDLNLAFVDAEPRPHCLFLSGNYTEWCQKDRSHWRGIESLLERGDVPIWASCGGAQGLAILADRGTQAPWDCPRCRDSRHPLLPIYAHIGHTAESACGQYEHNIAEKGPTALRIMGDDPVLSGLPRVFLAMESHVGEIAYLPEGWRLLVADGPGAKTRHQLLRAGDRPIYAAQFHIEMEGTPESAERLMVNFLREAERFNADHRRP
jgi:hypothetical protein